MTRIVIVLHLLTQLSITCASEAVTTTVRPVKVEFLDESCLEGDLKNRTVSVADGVLLSPMVQLVENAESDSQGSAAVHVSCDGAECLPSAFHYHFVAILQYPNVDVIRRSIITAQVNQAILWGASAVILLAMSAEATDHWQLNDTYLRPVILISENVSNIVTALAGARRVLVVMTEKASTTTTTTSDVAHIPTRLTLWAQCGRQSGLVKNRRGDEFWEDTVCMEPPAGKSRPSEWTIVAVLVTVFGLLLLFKGVGDEPGILAPWMAIHDSRSHSQSEKERQRRAEKALERLRSVKLTLTTLVEFAVDDERLDACAICLEEYALDQVMRILPCDHSFHQVCVDPWIIERQVCPLCKRDVILLTSTPDL